jgi:hypothetical protein
MPGANHAADDSREVGAIVAREERLERKVRQPGPADIRPIRFSFPGEIVVDVESPPDYVDAATTLTQIRVSTTVAEAGNNTVEVRVGGAVISQHTLPSGESTMVEAINIPVTPGTPLTVKTVTSVSGDNLSVIFRGQGR